MFPTYTRILICDDMPAIRDMVSRELRRLGYTQQATAADGAEAWRSYLDALTRDPFGLIISDWNMPRVTGLEFLQKVRGHSDKNDTPFILLTAEGQKEQVLDAISNGVTQYILKPFSSKNFEDKLLAAWQKVSSAKSA
jgi:two-component system chemotaxis response regulator CheY